MTIETERIYEISRDKFHGVFQIEWLNDGLEHLSRPVAVIEWNNELKEVLPFQVKFKEDKKMTNTLEFIKLSENATKPERKGINAGFDIFAAETVILEPQEKAVIKTDIAVNIPEGYVGLLTSRSGVSSKTHLVIETGKIDAGFQGNMGINIKNDKQNSPADTNVYITINGDYGYASQKQESGTYIVHKGDKLAQLVIVPIWTPKLKEVKEFSNVSERGTDGFGSTGY